jgi:hypothetical protein
MIQQKLLYKTHQLPYYSTLTRIKFQVHYNFQLDLHSFFKIADFCDFYNEWNLIKLNVFFYNNISRKKMKMFSKFDQNLQKQG